MSSSNNGNDYSSLVSKVWNFAHVLRDDGLENALEQLRGVAEKLKT